MINFKAFLMTEQYIDHGKTDTGFKTITIGETHRNYDREHEVQNMHFGVNDFLPIRNLDLSEAVHEHEDPNRLLVTHDGDTKTSKAAGILIPKHLWEGAKGVEGMKKKLDKRAAVYGGEHRAPISLAKMEKTHKDLYEDHFAKPIHQQIADEKAAIERLHKAGHLHSKDTTDEGEKTDTAQHEFDEEGRRYRARSTKGIAGHGVFTSGTSKDMKHYILNKCPAQTEGCGGGVDAHGLVDTRRGTCFAPNSETQYPSAVIRRSCQDTAKFDPAMTKDWALAHSHSLRTQAERADKKNERLLFRPNVLDESDVTSRHLLTHLNKQRESQGKPSIVGNSYGKTDQLHDPENNWHVTHSNIGPKTKDGKEIKENIGRDKIRIRNTIHATDVSGEDYKNVHGNKTPPKNSYMVTNVRRDSKLDKDFQKHVTHVKYWSEGKDVKYLKKDELEQGPEGHYDAKGKPTTPDKAHYGHTTITGEDGVSRRYSYQKQHVLHPRYVDVGGKQIATDSRFKDDEHYPAPKKRFRSSNGKIAGGILITTPTKSTSKIQHHTEFTHHVDNNTIEHAKRNNGEYEIDAPHLQEAARGKQYVSPIKQKMEDMKNG